MCLMCGVNSDYILMTASVSLRAYSEHQRLFDKHVYIVKGICQQSLYTLISLRAYRKPQLLFVKYIAFVKGMYAKSMKALTGL